MEGTVRLIDHCIIWVIAVFFIVHTHIGWNIDMMQKDGLMSSVFSGYKNIKE